MMSTIPSFKTIESKHDVYRNKDCIKKFCKSLWEHAMKIINLKYKKIVTNKRLKLLKLLTNERQKSN